MSQTNFIEDLKDIVTEHEFTIGWGIIEYYYAVGERLLEEKAEWSNEALQDIALEIDKPRMTRMMRYSIKLITKFPDKNLLPDGKAARITRIIRDYLTDPKEKEDCEHEAISVCRKCKKRLSLKDEAKLEL